MLVTDLGHHLQAMASLPRPHQGAWSPPAAMAKNLERQGRVLWNLCIRVKRDGGSAVAPSPGRAKLLVTARAFAFDMLELGRLSGRHRRHAEADASYLLNLALTLARICLAESEVRLA